MRIAQTGLWSVLLVLLLTLGDASGRADTAEKPLPRSAEKAAPKCAEKPAANCAAKPAAAVRELLLEKRYLNFPVKNKATRVSVRVSADRKVIDEFLIELAPAAPDFWVFLDVGAYQGQRARIEASAMPAGHPGLDAIAPSDQIRGAENLYHERFRPQFHFSTRRGWSNDPIGLVYYDGEYHLYYQHNPYGCQWGNVHWGHAVSADLVHWNELPIAIYPHGRGDWALSGSAVVDEQNTSGFQTGGEKVIVAAYTSSGRGECIAYSTDRGRTFTDYPGNPVIKHRGRHPNPIWYAPGKHWVMVVYDEYQGTRWIAFYSSPDLKTWTFQSRTKGYFECPDIFELPVDGRSDNKKWVLYAANGEYSVGRFDGKKFTPECPEKSRFNYGDSFYAPQTFSDLPAQDGRRIQMSWGRIGHPNMPFSQMMNFPVELTLRTCPGGIHLFAEPVKEIERLHDGKHAWQDVTIEEGRNLLGDLSGELFHIRGEFEIGEAEEFGFTVRGTPVAYNVPAQQLVGRCSAPMKAPRGRVRLELLVDRTSIEVFAGGGRIYMPIGTLLPEDDRTIGVFTRGGPTRLKSLEVFPLRSAWNE